MNRNFFSFLLFFISISAPIFCMDNKRKLSVNISESYEKKIKSSSVYSDLLQALSYASRLNLASLVNAIKNHGNLLKSDQKDITSFLKMGSPSGCTSSFDNLLHSVGPMLAKLLFNKNFVLRNEAEMILQLLTYAKLPFIRLLCEKYIDCMNLSNLIDLFKKTNSHTNNSYMYKIAYQLLDYELISNSVTPPRVKNIENFHLRNPKIYKEIVLKKNVITVYQDKKIVTFKIPDLPPISSLKSTSNENLFILFLKNNDFYIYDISKLTSSFKDRCNPAVFSSNFSKSPLIAYVPQINKNKLQLIKILNTNTLWFKYLYDNEAISPFIKLQWHSYNKNLLISLAKNTVLKIWNIHTSVCIKKASLNQLFLPGLHYNLTWSPFNNFQFFHITNNSIHIFDLANDTLKSLVETSKTYIFKAVACHPRYSHIIASLATIGNKSLIRLWDVTKLKSVEWIALNDTSVNDISWSQDNQESNWTLNIGCSSRDIKYKFIFPLLDICFNSDQLIKIIYLKQLMKSTETKKTQFDLLLKDLLEKK